MIVHFFGTGPKANVEQDRTHSYSCILTFGTRRRELNMTTHVHGILRHAAEGDRQARRDSLIFVLGILRLSRVELDDNI